ncbi:MAG: type IX secretion system membrane protein PorP/SprF [Cytophagaceae bacterium]|jgi:type IX secretion system PorP/SprF family membrane protein|nr:type IX secretion system membrane protein PorP/SprF [Cytophagaceae bacterium]
MSSCLQRQFFIEDEHAVRIQRQTGKMKAWKDEYLVQWMKWLFCGILLAYQGCYAQTEALYSSYLFNGLSINPAYAGYRECLNANLWYKKQWMGIDGSPASVQLSAHTPLPNFSSAVGLSLFNESWGVNRQTGVNGVFAHRIKLQESTFISGGLQAGFIQYNIDNLSLTRQEMSDPVFTENVSRFVPDFASGLYLHNQKFFLGAAAMHLHRNFFKPSSSGLYFRRQYFFSAGALLLSQYDVKIKPTLLLRGTEKARMQADLGMNILLKEVIWMGATFRSSGAWVFLTQLKLNHNLDFGYALDVNTGITRYRNFVSHEIMINQKFQFKNQEVVSPRYF